MRVVAFMLVGALLVSAGATAKGGPAQAKDSQQSKAAAFAADAELGCGFKVDLSKQKLHAVSWNDFRTTKDDRKKYVEKGEGEGGSRCAQTFRASEGAVFYRRYDSGKTPRGAARDGRSWTLDHGPNTEGYRQRMAI